MNLWWKLVEVRERVITHSAQTAEHKPRGFRGTPLVHKIKDVRRKTELTERTRSKSKTKRRRDQGARKRKRTCRLVRRRKTGGNPGEPSLGHWRKWIRRAPHGLMHHQVREDSCLLLPLLVCSFSFYVGPLHLLLLVFLYRCSSSVFTSRLLVFLQYLSASFTLLVLFSHPLLRLLLVCSFLFKCSPTSLSRGCSFSISPSKLSYCLLVSTERRYASFPSACFFLWLLSSAFTIVLRLIFLQCLPPSSSFSCSFSGLSTRLTSTNCLPHLRPLVRFPLYVLPSSFFNVRLLHLLPLVLFHLASSLT